jgi:hypothetical protein
MRDGWAIMLNWHLNVAKLQNEFWVMRSFIPEHRANSAQKR